MQRENLILTTLPQESLNPLYHMHSQSQAIILQAVVYLAELMQPFPKTKRYYYKYFYIAENQMMCHE